MEKKLNNLLGMEQYTEKDFVKRAKTTRRTEVAKDVLESAEYTGKNVFGEKMSKKQEIKAKELNNLISLDAFGEKALPDKKIKATKRTAVAKDVLEKSEYTGKDVFTEKPKSTEDVVYKKLHNLCCLDEFTEKEVLKDSKPTKRTDVAKDVLREKKEEEKECTCKKCTCDEDDDDEKPKKGKKGEKEDEKPKKGKKGDKDNDDDADDDEKTLSAAEKKLPDGLKKAILKKKQAK